MKIVRPEINYLERMTRPHAWVLSCACAAILLLSFPFQHGGWSSPGRPSTSLDQSEADQVLQEAATVALGQREGTIIVMDAQSGRIRALVNPKAAFAEAAMPGSTMKPFTALAALRAGLIDQDSRTVCPGRFTGLNFSLPCVHADHLPPFTPSQAIAYSCNYYFATLGQRLGRDNLIETLRQFGFGQLTGLNEVAGTLRPCETGNSARLAESNHVSGKSDCDARSAIGESDHIEVTPIQLLVAYTALVNGGHLLQPRYANDSVPDKTERATIDISERHRAIITEGMAGAVRYGTARSAHLDSLPLYILGKTGTSVPPKGFRSNGWFVGFAAASQPQGEPKPEEIELAVLVLLEHSHGAEAAAVSRSIFAAYAGARSQNSKVETTSIPTNEKSSVSNSQSKIKVHLVTENVTEELSLEDYVLGVMRAEGSMETEPEALKALAIAVRTYALKNRGRHAKDGFDFCSTTHCQRFASGVRSPSVSEGSYSNQALPNGRASDTMMAAVRSTEGQVLLDERGQLVEAYFGASCGGQTANVGMLWGVTPPAYLRGVRDEYCLSGPHANWSDTISRADLLRALQSDARTNIGDRLDQVSVSKRDETGRAEFITLEGEHRKSVRGWDFKIIVGRVLGWNVLKSSRFEVTRSGSNFVFRGSGFGHGLGLCQEGAHVMAERGSDFRRILEKYFPGTSIRNRIASMSSEGERSDLNAEAAEVFAEVAEENLCVPLRMPLRPSRLTASSDDHASALWKADLLNAPLHEHFVPAGLNANPKYLTISSGHFRVTYPADVDRRDANQVLSTLDSARSDFLRRADAASISIGDLPVLEIRLNDSTGDFTARTGQPPWAAAATRGNRIELQPVAILKRRGALFTTLRHELAHVVIDKAGHNRTPRWLEEGFAIYLAGEGSMISNYLRRGALPPEELEKKLERPGSREEMRALYAQAYTDVLSLVRNNGEASVWRRLAESS
ncbi:MAG: stage sporulation protein [Blastocatellia bacterium]|nr:stage sporulation protein [Blastocatellia bacterium]